MPREANPCNKEVRREDAYEVWATSDFSWIWYVLKKWQSPSNEVKNPYARWLCNVVSPMTSQRGETGDVYVADIKQYAYRIFNPLRPLAEQMKAFEVKPPPIWEATYVMGDGYDVMDIVEQDGWIAVSSWGKEGWNLGSWPLVIVFVRNKDGKFEVIEYVEGDVTLWRCPSALMRQQIIDSLAFFHWKHRNREWVKDFASIDAVPLDADLRGPYLF